MFRGDILMKICCISHPETTETTPSPTPSRKFSTSNQYLDSPTEKYCPLLKNGCEDIWTWDSNGKSPEVKLFGSAKHKALFHPGWSNGTAAVRGTKALDPSAITFWEIQVSHRIFGTSLMFGVGTKDATVHAGNFTNLIGADTHSWGLSHKGVIWHAGVGVPFVDGFRENVPIVLGLLFDGPRGTLRYFKDGKDLGVAFSKLNVMDSPLFPMISSTAARSEMTLGRRRRSFQGLRDMCLSAVSRSLRNPEDVDYLPPLPAPIKSTIRRRTEYFSESQ